MERAYLEELLGEGLSLAEIGRRVGRHEATVAYWLKKYGLRPVHREPRMRREGPSSASSSSALVDAPASRSRRSRVRRRGARARCAIGSMRYGLRRTQRPVAAAPRALLRRRGTRFGRDDAAPDHGTDRIRARPARHFRCKRCRAEAVTRRRRRVKRMLVAEAGGACCVCGYRPQPRSRFTSTTWIRRASGIELNARGAGVAIERAACGGAQVRAAVRQLPC